jgi:hypothetical protein
MEAVRRRRARMALGTTARRVSIAVVHQAVRAARRRRDVRLRPIAQAWSVGPACARPPRVQTGPPMATRPVRTAAAPAEPALNPSNTAIALLLQRRRALLLSGFGSRPHRDSGINAMLGGEDEGATVCACVRGREKLGAGIWVRSHHPCSHRARHQHMRIHRCGGCDLRCFRGLSLRS